MTLTLTLPMPPTVNHLHTVARGRKIKSAEARAYAELVAWRVVHHYLDNPGAWTPTNERLRVLIDIHPADRRRFDLDNRLKACLDSVFACWPDADDAQVDDLRITRHAPSDDPRAVVTIEAIA